VGDLSRAPHVGGLCFLDDDDKQRVFAGALELLERVGMVVDHEEATAMLAAAGCTADGDGRVRVPHDLVRRSLEIVPKVVDLYDRNGRPAVKLEGRRSYFGTGSDLLWTFDLESGERRRSTLEDVARAARLVDGLSHLDFVMSSGYPNDVEPHQAYVQSFAAMLRNTTKPIVTVAENGDDLRVICDLSAAVCGEAESLRGRPHFAVYSEPSSPLQHSAAAVEKLLVCARAGVPCVYVPAPMMGATAPMTVAGYLALGTAESLLGLVVHQLCRPGAPFVFGHGHAVLDMTTAQSAYNALDGYLIEMGMVEMAKWLDLPNFANAGTTDSQLVDAQAGLEIGQETLLVMQAGSNLNHNAGYLDFGLTVAPEMIVITDEVVALCRTLLAGIRVDDETLALDVIASVGPGGHFLRHRHTRRHLHAGHWRSTLLNRDRRAVWVERGGLDLRERARARALEILATHEPEPLAPHVAESLDELLSAAPKSAAARDAMSSPEASG
jgi:trimethylamine--corrinoid protein Co-methyltransferase